MKLCLVLLKNKDKDKNQAKLFLEFLLGISIITNQSIEFSCFIKESVLFAILLPLDRCFI